MFFLGATYEYIFQTNVAPSIEKKKKRKKTIIFIVEELEHKKSYFLC